MQIKSNENNVGGISFKKKVVNTGPYLVASDTGWYTTVRLIAPFPLRTGMILPCALFRTCLFSPIEMHFCCSLFSDHRRDFKK